MSDVITNHRTDAPEGRCHCPRAATVPAVHAAMALASSDDIGDSPMATAVKLDELLPALTAEVLAHAWDLAQAIGVDAHLDAELCQVSYDFMRANEEQMRSSGMFAAAVPPNTTDAAAQLIAFLGRDPGWTLRGSARIRGENGAIDRSA
jgi:hypothetical protein